MQGRQESAQSKLFCVTEQSLKMYAYYKLGQPPKSEFQIGEDTG